MITWVSLPPSRLTECWDPKTKTFIGVEEGSLRLDSIHAKGERFNSWLLILAHGFASAAVGPFAFKARYIDIPPAFGLGCLVGLLRVMFTRGGELHQGVTEIFAVALTSFLSRMLGSLRNGQLFCFSALAQSSIVLILPGYIVCGSADLIRCLS